MESSQAGCSDKPIISNNNSINTHSSQHRRRPSMNGKKLSSRSDRSSSTEDMAEDPECLEALENLLVPVTVLSTKDDDTRSSIAFPPQPTKENSSRKTKVSSNPPDFHHPPPNTYNNSDVVEKPNPDRMEDEEDDDDDDEFEDEGELEGSGGTTSTNVDPTARTGPEHRVRPPIIMPMPVMKRASLCLQEKVAIIRELENGEKQSWICKRKRLPKSTVQSIWKNRLKILEATEKIGMSRKRCRRAQHENIEDKLVQWIETLKAQNVPVNGPQLRAKAQVFARQLGIEDFRSSTGWLDKFKTRHNIAFKKSLKINNATEDPPSGSAENAGDKKFAIDWVTKVWPNLCEGYTPDNIFNADEFGLFYRALPDQGSKLVNETCHGGRMAQDRLTILTCVNSDGSEKRKLVVVGCHGLAGPINPKNLPVNYHNDSKSWMTRGIFQKELQSWDAELRAVNRNVLLILDNSPAHTVEENFSNIKLVFLPPVVASILQPLEHGIIQQIKLQYRRLMLDKIIRQSQSSQVEHYLAKSTSDTDINILDAIVMLDCAWTSVSAAHVLECFKTSNLQSINVSDSTSVSEMGGSDGGFVQDTELIEKACASVPQMHIPQNFNLRSFSEMDNRLHVTDYINEENHGEDQTEKNSGVSSEIFTVSPEICSKTQVQEFLTLIRNWVMVLPTDLHQDGSSSSSSSIHKSISILENFALQQPGPTVRMNHHHLPPPASQNISMPSNSARQGQSSGSNNRLLLNAAAGMNSGMNLGPQQAATMLTSIPSTVAHHHHHHPHPHNSHNNNNSSHPNSSPTTVVTFTLADSLQQPNLPHHLLEQQQFFAYLT